MSHVFISYKHDDLDFAENLKAKLENAGFKTWMDNDKLRAGKEWRNDIDKNIKEAFAFIVIMSPEAKASEYVTYEWAFAWGAGIDVIPVLYEKTELHPRLEALQFLDFTNKTHRPWDNLIAEIKKVEAEKKTKDLVATTEKLELLLSETTIPIPPKAPLFVKNAVIALDSSNANERIQAIDSLKQANHPAAEKALEDALQHSIRDVRIEAAFSLAQTGNIHVLPPLLEACGNEKKVLAASEALQYSIHEILLNGPSNVDRLMEFTQNGDGSLRALSARLLGEIGEVKAVPYLINLKNDTYIVSFALYEDKIINRKWKGISTEETYNKEVTSNLGIDGPVWQTALRALRRFNSPEAIAFVKDFEDKKNKEENQFLA